ncbi:sigma-54 dependent transcriptional regulator [Enterovibrio sp. ZSDZ42]|uniref:Sigma-54 dependent transcriptional regulator n=1 Tax=Enterovibrio gelatinilyticus TaxID=2899819 RepID=A0ABT5QZV6_9GAMM|nr:sigma-54 dependent transcriptional regulator [Enterovibrio sp. ZSDZ42]MDD1793546.1 sigma-54 dependent transcriptional regulator [Enterovibrio sp. ZSDZ42]
MKQKWQILMLQCRHVQHSPRLATQHVDYELTQTQSWDEFAATLQSAKWDMVLIPSQYAQGVDAAELLGHRVLKQFGGPVVVVAMADQASSVSRAMQHGAVDYLLAPFESFHLSQLVNRLKTIGHGNSDVVTESAHNRQLFQMAQRVAQTDASVLINGESGTGKEVLARFIHNASPRANGPFVAINCAALPESMIESILFGHAKGAFTGAIQSHPGKLEVANQGSLLLDEIGELPLAMQTKLLRVLQEREVERLGCNKKIKLDIRVLAATNLDLEVAVAEGRFRSDLYYRLNVFPLQCAPLRERKQDILPLASNMIKRYVPDYHESIGFSSDAKQLLETYPWPGNVRELENVIQRAMVLSRGCVIRAEDLMLPGAFAMSDLPELDAVVVDTPAPIEPNRQRMTNDKPSLRKSRKLAEFDTIIDTLRRFDGHRSKSAEELGVSTRALRYKIQTMRENGWDIEQILAHGPNDLAEPSFHY